jgi:AhpD family alkylhydroperoxidase
MQARMNSPALMVPEALRALRALGEVALKGSVPLKTHHLMHLRASQINGCGFCVDMHARELREGGETDERLATVAAWRDSLYFSPAERAALALTEAVTRLNDRVDPVPDAIWEEATRHYDERGLASLLLSIAAINAWNRLNVATRQVAGARRPVLRPAASEVSASGHNS